jgi:hypothetical protein
LPPCRFDSLYTTAKGPENLNCASSCGFLVRNTTAGMTSERETFYCDKNQNNPFLFSRSNRS